ncbi:MAG: glycosyltransferase, partial [Elusimicrobia bacterium]|nr:glycosyltransferase [Elusimicrobiota bacterium]
LRIVRIKCGPEDKFVAKEKLWPFMKDYTDGIKKYYDKEGVSPDIFTSHYADGGLAGAMLKESMDVPYTHTGHSLGGEKMDKLNLSRSNFEMINKNFKFHLRISAERVAFRNAAAIVASTGEEVSKQYGHHVYKDALKDKSKFNIIPPGIGPEQFFSYHKDEKKKETYDKAGKKIKGEIKKYIDEERRDLPCIFSAARFDAKKNPTGLLRAYASSEKLQDNANVMIVAGNIEDPLNPENRNKFKEHEKFIIEDLADIVKNWNLKGKVSFSPGLDYVDEMPFVYRYAARSKWIFVNPALHEPFGLTIIEAMASGLPVAATQNGGPSEILEGGRHGVLVEPTLPHSLRKGLEKLLIASQWKKFSNAGTERVKEKFTWGTASKGYRKLFKKLIKEGIDKSDDFKIPEYFMNPEEGSDSKLRKELRHLYFKV